MLVMFCMMTFSDVVPENESQLVFGYVCCFLEVAHLIVNLTVIVSATIKKLKLNFLGFKKKRQSKIVATSTSKQSVCLETQFDHRVVNLIAIINDFVIAAQLSFAIEISF